MHSDSPSRLHTASFEQYVPSTQQWCPGGAVFPFAQHVHPAGAHPPDGHRVWPGAHCASAGVNCAVRMTIASTASAATAENKIFRWFCPAINFTRENIAAFSVRPPTYQESWG